jgi:hypothetical protein
MVDENAIVAGGGEGFGENRRSHITNKDATSVEMQLNYEPTTRAQKNGEGDKTWYFYEFNNDSTSNMLDATFMVSTGTWNPQKQLVVFENRENVAGFWITPSGEIVPFSNGSEMDKKPQS